MNPSSDQILLKTTIRKLLSDVLKDLQGYISDQHYQASLEKYVTISDMLLKPYKHHLGYSFNSQTASFRFEIETALLMLLSEIIKTHLSSEGILDHKFLWPADDVDSLFSWYKLPDRFSSSLAEISQYLTDTHHPELLLSEICGDVLIELGDSVIGEFYTPLNVADHLIESSGISPMDILAGKRAIDPACGGGIVLLRLFTQTTEFSKKTHIPLNELLKLLSDNILGFDIQPFAVDITKTLLLYSRFLFFGNDAPITDETLPKIELKDTLSTDQIYWSDGSDEENLKGFDFIIGNPPYMSVKGADIPNIKKYREVIFGHPNLYQLFIWWAIRAANTGGVICFLIPQSIISGNYYKNLRAQIEQKTQLLSVTRFMNSTGIVGNADIQIMTVCFQIVKKHDDNHKVKIQVSQNGHDIKKVVPVLVSSSKVINKTGIAQSNWIISGSSVDYDIFQKLEQSATFLGSSLLWSIGNGNYVWNQNKECLRKDFASGYIPLISAASIRNFNFIFPYLGSHPSKGRQFSVLNSNLETLKFSGPILLIQRTTPRKLGHRIVAAVPAENFYKEHPFFFLENHVNFILSYNKDINLLNGLLGWINSDLFNYVFLVRNGTNLVAVNELKLLPVNVLLLNDLALLTEEITNASPNDKVSKLKDLNNFVFESFSLEQKEIERISSVLKSQGGSE